MCDPICVKDCPEVVTLVPTKIAWETGQRSVLTVKDGQLPLGPELKPDQFWILKKQGGYSGEPGQPPQGNPDMRWVETMIDWTPMSEMYPFLKRPLNSIVWWTNSANLVLLKQVDFKDSPCEFVTKNQYHNLTRAMSEPSDTRDTRAGQLTATQFDTPGIYGFASGNPEECAKGQYMFICVE